MGRSWSSSTQVRQPAYSGRDYRVVGELKKADFVMDRVFWIGVYPGIDSPRLEYVLDMLMEMPA